MKRYIEVISSVQCTAAKKSQKEYPV